LLVARLPSRRSAPLTRDRLQWVEVVWKRLNHDRQSPGR
jgi:hypothetical protein